MNMSEQPVVYELPVLPLKSAVLFPYLVMPLSAGRPASIAAVEAALASESKEVLVFTQRDGDVDVPTQDDHSEPFLKARVAPLPLPEDTSSEIEALQGALVDLAGEALTLAQPNAPQEL